MKLLSIDYIPDTNIEVLDMVRGVAVQTKGVTGNIPATFKNVAGGEIMQYTELLNEARQLAVKRMVDKTEKLNADAVIGIRYATSQLMTGAAEIVAYGTAVKTKGGKEDEAVKH